MDKKEWQKARLEDREFSFEMLPADKAVVLSMQVVDAFGGLVVSFLTMTEKDQASGLSGMQSELLSALSSVKPEKSKAIFDAMLPCCFVRNTTDPRDAGHRCSYNDFNGRIMELYKVMFYGIRYNFSDFFGGSLLSGVQAQEAQDASA